MNKNMKNLKEHSHDVKVYKEESEFIKTIANNKSLIEPSFLLLDLSNSLIEKIDLFLSNTNLDKNHQEQLIKLMEEIYSESYVSGMIQ